MVATLRPNVLLSKLLSLTGSQNLSQNIISKRSIETCWRCVTEQYNMIYCKFRCSSWWHGLHWPSPSWKENSVKGSQLSGQCLWSRAVHGVLVNSVLLSVEVRKCCSTYFLKCPLFSSSICIQRVLTWGERSYISVTFVCTCKVICKDRPYRAVITLRVDYKNQSVNVVKGYNGCFFSDPHKTH